MSTCPLARVGVTDVKIHFVNVLVQTTSIDPSTHLVNVFGLYQQKKAAYAE